MDRGNVTVYLNQLISAISDDQLEDTDFTGKSIIDDLKFDSVALMQLVAEIEEHFGVELDTSESLLELLDSYDELVEYLVKESGGGV